MKHFREAAKEALSYFIEERRRDVLIVTIRPGAPAWVDAMVMNAHMGQLQDDFTFRLVRDNLLCIVNNLDAEIDWDEYELAEWLDEQGDAPVIGKILEWMSLRSANLAYVDEALESEHKYRSSGDLFTDAYRIWERNVDRIVADKLFRQAEEQDAE